MPLICPISFASFKSSYLFVLNNEDVKDAYLFDGYDPTNTVKYFTPVGYHIMDIINVAKNVFIALLGLIE